MAEGSEDLTVHELFAFVEGGERVLDPMRAFLAFRFRARRRDVCLNRRYTRDSFQDFTKWLCFCGAE